MSSSFYKRPTWTPSPEQSQLALAAIYKYLDATLAESKTIGTSSEAKKIAYIQNNFSAFAVQFQGIGSESKRVIWCNFFPIAEHPDWMDSTVFMRKGSKSLYWSIEYNPDKDECRGFTYPWVKL